MAGPTAPSTHKPQKTIKVGGAYEREFQRYLVRMILERHPDAVAKFLDSKDAKSLPVENRLLATLALGEVATSCSRTSRQSPITRRTASIMRG